MIDLLTRLIAVPNVKIPDEMDNISMKKRMENIAAIFSKYGSEQLKVDIQNAKEELFNLIGLTIEEVLVQLELEDKKELQLKTKSNGK